MKSRTPIKAEVRLKFKFQPAQARLLRKVKRGAGTYIQLAAPQCLEIGGIRPLPVDELIPTPTGWKRNGDLVEGDIIFDESGKPCTVLIAHAPQYDKTYKITFDDGNEILAGQSHLWLTSTHKELKNAARRTEEFRSERREKRRRDPEWPSINRGKGMKFDAPTCGIRTTKEIFETQKHRRQCNHSIPLTRPLELPKAKLSLDPYILGVWLGDGTALNGSITAHPDDGKELAQLFFIHGFKFQQSNCDEQRWLTDIYPKLKQLGVVGNKHIPSEYLRASISQRLALLQGLMDTDGSCSRSGHVEFSNTNKRIIDGVSELLTSLGIKHRFVPKRAKCMYKGEARFSNAWRTSFSTSLPMFQLPRKRNRQKLVDGYRNKVGLRRYITNVVEVEPVLMRCITVSSPSHLYLAGRGMIPTHNSGKTTGKLMFGVENYCLRFGHCDVLILRRTFPELDAGAIQDFKTHVPEELYDWNATQRVATFKANGSRVVFAGCVREGTLVTTRRGLIPIEQVTTEDYVLTRKGYRRVLWSGQTGVKRTVKLDNVWLTLDHKVYCNGDFIPAHEILCLKGFEKTVRLLIQKQSYLKASPIVDIQTRIGTGTENIIQDGEGRNTFRFTSLFTRVFTVPCRRVLKSITRTTTVITTPLRILSSLLEANTGSTINPIFILGPQKFVSSADESSEQSIPTSEELVLNLVAGFISPMSLPVPVYDLTVEDQHEYFANGILVHNCVNNQDRDIQKYLGQAYPFILVDECGQFSPAAWELLYSRNTVNAACEPDENGNFPIPTIVGCTNPIGPFWEYYHAKFVLKEPWEKEDGLRRAKDGSYWAPDADTWRLVYNPNDYAANHTTVLDNPIYIKERDPGIIARLKALPKAKMQKMLLGLMDKVEGQYFDCWSEEQHVVDLREDPEAVIWQPWQPCWAGQDFGVGHWNAIHVFTKALVRSTLTDDYKLKTVCFAEVAPESTGHTDVMLADMLNMKCYYPRLPEDHPQYNQISGKRIKLSALYFSHEKFSRQMQMHSPADEYSRLLRERGLPSVSRATMDRIGSAAYMYNELKKGNLVILKSCPGIIQAIPSLQRDPNNLDDVLKVDSKADDRYDSFRYGLYGQFKARGTPVEVEAKAYADKLDPFARHFYLQKQRYAQKHKTDEFRQKDVPVWITKL